MRKPWNQSMILSISQSFDTFPGRGAVLMRFPCRRNCFRRFYFCDISIVYFVRPLFTIPTFRDDSSDLNIGSISEFSGRIESSLL